VDNFKPGIVAQQWILAALPTSWEATLLVAGLGWTDLGWDHTSWVRLAHGGVGYHSDQGAYKSEFFLVL